MSMTSHLITDNRVCFRCGCRAGNCQHLQAEPIVKDIRDPDGARAESRKIYFWADWEVRELRARRLRGHSAETIADALSRTEGSVRNKIVRMGLHQGAQREG